MGRELEERFPHFVRYILGTQVLARRRDARDFVGPSAPDRIRRRPPRFCVDRGLRREHGAAQSTPRLPIGDVKGEVSAERNAVVLTDSVPDSPVANPAPVPDHRADLRLRPVGAVVAVKGMHPKQRRAGGWIELSRR